MSESKSVRAKHREHVVKLAEETQAKRDVQPAEKPTLTISLGDLLAGKVAR
jgi:hypothetical protein